MTLLSPLRLCLCLYGFSIVAATPMDLGDQQSWQEWSSFLGQSPRQRADTQHTPSSVDSANGHRQTSHDVGTFAQPGPPYQQNLQSGWRYDPAASAIEPQGRWEHNSAGQHPPRLSMGSMGSFAFDPHLAHHDEQDLADQASPVPSHVTPSNQAGFEAASSSGAEASDDVASQQAKRPGRTLKDTYPYSARAWTPEEVAEFSAQGLSLRTALEPNFFSRLPFLPPPPPVPSSIARPRYVTPASSDVRHLINQRIFNGRLKWFDPLSLPIDERTFRRAGVLYLPSRQLPFVTALRTDNSHFAEPEIRITLHIRIRGKWKQLIGHELDGKLFYQFWGLPEGNGRGRHPIQHYGLGYVNSADLDLVDRHLLTMQTLADGANSLRAV
ncbi:hypothetical protein PSEUBRA_006037 [Kalmanozyma brasiliensis GHG001]|uniref:uncharacterized protein n=1 Tax=Kalmanozyma brasiliensis (strain GHG001) TaxID=1365824 RepID=UPI001CE812E6|nr:uncharacterized protein PSEUBRA_006037 [Kalmanozyma brasiliensis GHG001]KAF6767601.1 hypothetical protein PSEUBRA_006037 [Kalmanozyma brasiliensis GHG001]